MQNNGKWDLQLQYDPQNHRYRGVHNNNNKQ